VHQAQLKKFRMRVQDHQLSDAQHAKIMNEFVRQDDVERMPENFAPSMCRAKIRDMLDAPRL